MKNDSRNEATNIINKSSDASLRTSPSKYYDEETEVILLLLVAALQVSPQRQCLTSFLFGSLNSFANSRDVNRGSKNWNSLQIRVLEIEFSNSKLDITFCISPQAVTQAAGDRASRFCANGQTWHNGPACPLNRDATAKARCQLETLVGRTSLIPSMEGVASATHVMPVTCNWNNSTH